MIINIETKTVICSKILHQAPTLFPGLLVLFAIYILIFMKTNQKYVGTRLIRP